MSDQHRVYDVAVVTPLDHARGVSKQLGVDVYLKREDLQPVHSFKLRGAYNKIVALTAAQKKRGVIAASAGNHAQGVALSAKRSKIDATIVMPTTTPKIKIDAVRSHGARVVLYGDSYSDSYDHAMDLVKKNKMTFVHPFDDELVIEGQGTLATEILEQLPSVTHVFVPVGGGGLLAGVLKIIKKHNPKIVVIGVEAQDSNSMQMSLRKQKRVVLDHVGIFADGVAVKQVGSLTYATAKKYVDRIITVDNDEICAAIKNTFEETRSICEPAGALALAGAKKYFATRKPTKTPVKAVCINSGANMTFERLQFIAERTLVGAKAESLFAVTLDEQRGSLKTFYREVIHGFSISEFCYRLGSRDEAHIFIGLITGNDENKAKVIERMKKYNFEFTDLSNDDYAKEHVRFMIGGKSTVAEYERIYSFDFPERPGALRDFLDAISNKFNISLFHYRGQGGDVGQVLMGFEAQDVDELELLLHKAGYQYERARSKSINIFL